MDVPGWTRNQAVSGIQQRGSDTGLGGEPGGNGQKKGEQDNRTSYQIHAEGIILKERSGFLTAQHSITHKFQTMQRMDCSFKRSFCLCRLTPRAAGPMVTR